MAHKVAIFSDGTKDVYKGNRDVKAAWAIFNKETGELLLSGHSLDRVRAEKTARNNVSYIASDVGVDGFHIRITNAALNINHINYIKSEVKLFRKMGFLDDYEVGKHKISKLYDAGIAKAKEYNQNRKSEILSRVRIEIVDI